MKKIALAFGLLGLSAFFNVTPMRGLTLSSSLRYGRCNLRVNYSTKPAADMHLVTACLLSPIAPLDCNVDRLLVVAGGLGLGFLHGLYLLLYFTGLPAVFADPRRNQANPPLSINALSESGSASTACELPPCAVLVLISGLTSFPARFNRFYVSCTPIFSLCTLIS